MGDIAEALLSIECEQSKRLSSLTFNESKIAFVYNPLEYAFETHSDYVKKYCKQTKPVLFIGMNPGPFGMAQNGVPFGDRDIVRDWLLIEGIIGKPSKEHPKRPIKGFDCNRSEVSGQRFWGLIKELCETPETFFKYSFVHNYCPLSFMKDSGKNVTPPQLKHKEMHHLFQICDQSLRKTILLLKPTIIVTIGSFVEQRTIKVLKSGKISAVKVHRVLHPSPINPKANKGWKENVSQQLSEIGVMDYLRPNSRSFNQTFHCIESENPK